DDARYAGVPAERIELRDRHAHAVDTVRGPELEVAREIEPERADRADADAGVHDQPSVSARAMLLPPSTWRVRPVTKSDSRDARYTAAYAMSSATPRRVRCMPS